jgi:mersacidin/lichenicidin family type 2 lantibiotic
MSNLNIIRAWKDEEYSENLSREEQALLPQNPAGLLELSDQELAEVDGQSSCNITCDYTCFLTKFTN